MKAVGRVLVTGGFGFIGSHLVQDLVAHHDFRVHVVDDMSTSPIDLHDYLDEIGRPDNLTFDLCSIEEYFGRADIPIYNFVYHLASPVGPAGVLEHAGEMVRQIVDDSYRLMDYCREARARLLYVSTSEVYGGGKDGYCSESTLKIVPPKTTVRLEYAVAKLAAEIALINMCRVSRLEATIVRPFNVTGPRQSPRGGFVVPRFIRQAHSGEPLTVFGDGSAIRAFTHVKDMVCGIKLVMTYGRIGQAYNLGNPGNRISISELANRIISIANSSSEKVFVDPKMIYGPLYEEANDKFPEATMAREELGWEPIHDVDETIRDAYLDFVMKRSALEKRVAGK
jgi:UDP-glucose 4-epimerase